MTRRRSLSVQLQLQLQLQSPTLASLHLCSLTGRPAAEANPPQRRPFPTPPAPPCAACLAEVAALQALPDAWRQHAAVGDFHHALQALGAVPLPLRAAHGRPRHQQAGQLGRAEPGGRLLEAGRACSAVRAPSSHPAGRMPCDPWDCTPRLEQLLCPSALTAQLLWLPLCCHSGEQGAGAMACPWLCVLRWRAPSWLPSSVSAPSAVSACTYTVMIC